MKTTFLALLVCLILSLASFSQHVPEGAPAAELANGKLKLELRELEQLAEQIKTSRDDQGKTRLWLTLNHAAKQFADHLQATFPNTTIQGDKISPARAQELAHQASSYGVRVEFCEMAARWSADNQGYEKYLELWPDGPEADESTWMGPMGNGAYCGDFEGSVEELQQTITQHKAFLKHFPKSRFATQAKQELLASEAQLKEALKSRQPQ
jgi:hypothetical protein